VVFTVVLLKVICIHLSGCNFVASQRTSSCKKLFFNDFVETFFQYLDLTCGGYWLAGNMVKYPVAK